MRKKAQLEGIVYIIIVIIVVGFLLAWFSPLIKNVAEDTYSNVSEDKVFSRSVLIMLSPLSWVFYIILSLIVLYFAFQGGG